MNETPKPTNITQSKRWLLLRLPALALSASLLASCGGGGGNDSGPCGGPGNLSLDVTYEVNGQLVDPRSTVVVTRGVPLLATPKAVGLPAGYTGDARWSYSTRDDVPAGLSFSTATGVISGTPTARAVFRVELRLSVAGYTADVRRTIDFFM